MCGDHVVQLYSLTFMYMQWFQLIFSSERRPWVKGDMRTGWLQASSLLPATTTWLYHKTPEEQLANAQRLYESELISAPN